LALKDGTTILVEIVDKIITTSAPRPKKPSKEEPKIPLYFTVRQNEQ
jgi:hypothetical protein